MSLLSVGIVLLVLGGFTGMGTVIFGIVNIFQMRDGNIDRGFRRHAIAIGVAAFGGSLIVSGLICIALHVLSKAGLT